MLKIINTQKRARDNFLIIWSDKSNQSGHEPSLIQKVANSPPHPAKYGFVLHDGQLHTHTLQCSDKARAATTTKTHLVTFLCQLQARRTNGRCQTRHVHYLAILPTSHCL